ncbi:uncharacterized protein [Diadema setosum]|uniref:uncharacterized protein n=1 Tax=Diadema setosum TaxID=31175 RepID=UPI003B3A6DE0
MARSGEESCSSSSIGLESVSYSQRIPHPQSWTEVPEYNMSLRQQNTHDPFGNWKYDVQCQIAHIAKKLKQSLGDHPDTRVRGYDMAWRPTLDESRLQQSRRGDTALPLYPEHKRPVSADQAPPPSKEETEGFYHANSTADPSYALSFGLGSRNISR